MNKDEKKAFQRVINDTAAEILIDVQKKSWDIYKELLTALHQKIGAILNDKNQES